MNTNEFTTLESVDKQFEWLTMHQAEINQHIANPNISIDDITNIQALHDLIEINPVLKMHPIFTSLHDKLLGQHEQQATQTPTRREIQDVHEMIGVKLARKYLQRLDQELEKKISANPEILELDACIKILKTEVVSWKYSPEQSLKIDKYLTYIQNEYLEHQAKDLSLSGTDAIRKITTYFQQMPDDNQQSKYSLLLDTLIEAANAYPESATENGQYSCFPGLEERLAQTFNEYLNSIYGIKTGFAENYLKNCSLEYKNESSNDATEYLVIIMLDTLIKNPVLAQKINNCGAKNISELLTKPEHEPLKKDLLLAIKTAIQAQIGANIPLAAIQITDDWLLSQIQGNPLAFEYWDNTEDFNVFVSQQQTHILKNGHYKEASNDYTAEINKNTQKISAIEQKYNIDASILQQEINALSEADVEIPALKESLDQLAVNKNTEIKKLEKKTTTALTTCVGELQSKFKSQLDDLYTHTVKEWHTAHANATPGTMVLFLPDDKYLETSISSDEDYMPNMKVSEYVTQVALEEIYTPPEYLDEDAQIWFIDVATSKLPSPNKYFDANICKILLTQFKLTQLDEDEKFRKNFIIAAKNGWTYFLNHISKQRLEKLLKESPKIIYMAKPNFLIQLLEISKYSSEIIDCIIPDQDGNTPLEKAIADNDTKKIIDIIKMLKKNSFSDEFILQPKIKGIHILLQAVLTNNPETVSILVHTLKEYNIDDKSIIPEGLLLNAFEHANIETIQKLIQTLDEVKIKHQTILDNKSFPRICLHAVKNNKTEQLKSLIDALKKAGMSDEFILRPGHLKNMYTPLMLVMKIKDIAATESFIKYLQQAGLSNQAIFQTNIKAENPLHVAIKHNITSNIVKMIVSKVSEAHLLEEMIFAKNEDGKTPLQMVISTTSDNSKESVEEILSGLQNCFIEAVKADDTNRICRIVEFLRTVDTPLDLMFKPNNIGHNPLHIAIINQKPNTIELLIGLDDSLLEQKDIHGKTPLDYATNITDPKTIAALKKHIKNADNTTADKTILGTTKLNKSHIKAKELIEQIYEQAIRKYTDSSGPKK